MKTHHYVLCGLDNIYLANGFTEKPTRYGVAVAVEDIEGLHKAIAMDLVTSRRKLGGKEVRFLRKELDLSQEALATLLETTAQTVARWEKGQTEIPGPADRLLRVIYRESNERNPDVLAMLGRLSKLDALAYERRVFKETSKGWRPASAA